MLDRARCACENADVAACSLAAFLRPDAHAARVAPLARRAGPAAAHRHGVDPGGSSEEHTSELQSPCNLVCRLLLEKKNKKSSFHPKPNSHHHIRTVKLRSGDIPSTEAPRTYTTSHIPVITLLRADLL